MKAELKEEPFRRDPAFVQLMLPLVKAINLLLRHRDPRLGTHPAERAVAFVVRLSHRRSGLVPAKQSTARRALKRGAGVLVFPGGDYEVFRPWSERNTIEFGGRTGFIELALASGVPVVPMIIHGRTNRPSS